jgi:hypothetical protein
MLFSFHRVKLAPRVSALAVIAVAAAGAVWLAWPKPLVATPPEPEAFALTGGELEKSSATCVLVESVSLDGASLILSPDGTAQALFGDDEFRGAARDGYVYLTFEKSFDWADGCRWVTRQSISGWIGQGKLLFRYGEEPLPGQNGCFYTCNGTADVTLR